ncbi:MAG TPA: hypothetical protein VGF24_37325 [Vicinamibacterales bacterium]|jgi:hypothetical protein
MADVACPYTLAAPGGTIYFNDGAADQYYIQAVHGLDGAPIRAPIDDVPFGDGGLSYNFWKGGRHVSIEGIFLIQTIDCGPGLVTIWNQMEEALRVALESIAATIADTGSLSWTPTGLALRTLGSVRNDVPLDCQPDQNFTVRTFSFGLFSDTPDWT